jgi:hypothetical protein
MPYIEYINLRNKIRFLTINIAHPHVVVFEEGFHHSQQVATSTIIGTFQNLIQKLERVIWNYFDLIHPLNYYSLTYHQENIKYLQLEHRCIHQANLPLDLRLD